jgi:hypothetical protein
LSKQLLQSGFNLFSFRFFHAFLIFFFLQPPAGDLGCAIIGGFFRPDGDFWQAWDGRCS